MYGTMNGSLAISDLAFAGGHHMLRHVSVEQITLTLCCKPSPPVDFRQRVGRTLHFLVGMLRMTTSYMHFCLAKSQNNDSAILRKV